MSIFLEIVLAFPTVLFTVALVGVLLYWMMVVLGAIDVEILDSTDGMIDGALEGAIDGIDGALEGAIDGMDGAIDGIIDGADGALEGALDSADGALDSVADMAEGLTGLGPVIFIASVFRLGKVPLTVSLSCFVLWGWLVGFLLTWLYRGSPGLMPHLVFSIIAMGGCLVFAALLTNISVRPLEPIFTLHTARERASLISEECVITTGRVDSSFGQATAHVGNDDLIFQVRCDSKNNIQRGESVLIVHFDNRRDAYVVEPIVHS